MCINQTQIMLNRLARILEFGSLVWIGQSSLLADFSCVKGRPTFDVVKDLCCVAKIEQGYDSWNMLGKQLFGEWLVERC